MYFSFLMSLSFGKDDSSSTSKTFLTGKTSRGLTIPAYLAHKYEYSGGRQPIYEEIRFAIITLIGVG